MDNHFFNPHKFESQSIRMQLNFVYEFKKLINIIFFIFMSFYCIIKGFLVYIWKFVSQYEAILLAIEYLKAIALLS